MTDEHRWMDVCGRTLVDRRAGWIEPDGWTSDGSRMEVRQMLDGCQLRCQIAGDMINGDTIDASLRMRRCRLLGSFAAVAGDDAMDVAL